MSIIPKRIDDEFQREKNNIIDEIHNMNDITKQHRDVIIDSIMKTSGYGALLKKINQDPRLDKLLNTQPMKALTSKMMSLVRRGKLATEDYQDCREKGNDNLT